MEPDFDVEALELALLLEGIFQRFGSDYRHHDKEFVRQRLHGLMEKHAISNFTALLEAVMHQPDFYPQVLRVLDERPSSWFSNPAQLVQLRKLLVPWIRSCAAPKIWIPDGATAEDIYGLAILLQEENLGKTRLYATGPNEELLLEAKQGRFAANLFAEYERIYLAGGGRATFADYCSFANDQYMFHPALGENIVWSDYHLTSDTSINEFEAIICMGGFLHYTPYLKQRAVQIFYESQPVFGILTLLGGHSAEPALVHRYRPLCETHHIFQRART